MPEREGKYGLKSDEIYRSDDLTTVMALSSHSADMSEADKRVYETAAKGGRDFQGFSWGFSIKIFSSAVRNKRYKHFSNTLPWTNFWSSSVLFIYRKSSNNHLGRLFFQKVQRKSDCSRDYSKGRLFETYGNFVAAIREALSLLFKFMLGLARFVMKRRQFDVDETTLTRFVLGVVQRLIANAHAITGMFGYAVYVYVTWLPWIDPLQKKSPRKRNRV